MLPKPVTATARPATARRGVGLDPAWWTALKLAWAVYWPVRLALSLMGALVVELDPRGLLPPVHGIGAWVERLLIEPWTAFDVDWYTRIAREGYGVADGRAAFHPLLPLLMRIGGMLLGGNYALAGIIVANVACVVCLAALYRLTEEDYGVQVARDTARWMLWAPTGFVLLIPYTEPLMLCFAMLALWFARKERWLAAGLCGAFAALAKQPAIALAPVLLWQYWRAHRGDLLRWRTVRVLACIGLVPLGYIGYSLYRTLLLSDIATDSFPAFLTSLMVSRQLQQEWGGGYGLPWEMVARVVLYMPYGTLNFWLRLVLVLAGLAIFARALRHTPSTNAVFGLTQIGLSLIILLDGDPIMSLPRRIMLAFPIFVQLALWTGESHQRNLWFGLSLCAMLAYAVLSVTRLMVP